MGYGYEPKNEKKMPSKAKQIVIDKSKLTPVNKLKMKYHANHHNMKHIKTMILQMEKKVSFKNSHIYAVKNK